MIYSSSLWVFGKAFIVHILRSYISTLHNSFSDFYLVPAGAVVPGAETPGAPGATTPATGGGGAGQPSTPGGGTPGQPAVPSKS